jgi:multiple sugar transport system substrate-binding protein
MSTYNPRTRRYFGISDYYVPAPLIWRHDVWEAISHSPATWEHVREAAPLLKAAGHPLGIGQSSEPDSNTALLSLLMSFGAFLQDESGALAIESERTVEAVELLAEVQAQGGDPSVFSWNPSSNNQFVLSGDGSLVVNAISPIHRADDLGMPFARDLWIWPVPGGPGGRIGVGQYTAVYSVWKFARNVEAAERFLADLCLAAPLAVQASRFFNYPSFPGAYPSKRIYRAAAAETRPPKGKYSILTTVASQHTRNAGHPGPTNAAVQEVLDRYLLPRMFAEVSLGRMTATESVRATAREMRTIWRRWRAAGKI